MLVFVYVFPEIFFEYTSKYIYFLLSPCPVLGITWYVLFCFLVFSPRNIPWPLLQFLLSLLKLHSFIMYHNSWANTLFDGPLVVSNLLLFRTVIQWVPYYRVTSCRCNLHLKDKGLRVEIQCQRLHAFVILMNVVQLTSPQRLYKQCERGLI